MPIKIGSRPRIVQAIAGNMRRNPIKADCIADKARWASIR